jgi:hypothetical protein
MMRDLLFDTPWWLPTSVLVVGVFLFITGNNRQEFRIRTLGMVVAALALVLAVVSYVVDTDREKSEKGTRALVKAVAARDWPTMQNLMAQRASLAVQAAGTVYANRDAVVEGAKMGVERFGLKVARITSMDSQQNQSMVTVTFDALTEQDTVPLINSTWQMEWQKTADGMKVVRITNLKIGRQTGQGASSQFPRK